MKQNKAAWKLYLKDCAGKIIPKYAAPARETDYSDLPPAATFVGGSDAFRDETAAYVNRLKKAGVPVEFKLLPGSFHTSESIAPRAKSSREAADFLIRAYLHACTHCVSPQEPLIK